MKKLMLVLLFACTPVMAQDMVTDKVTMPDGSAAYLKHNKNSGVQVTPKATVTIDKVSKFANHNLYEDNVYVYPITVKGTPCVVVSTYRDGLAISCGWKQ